VAFRYSASELKGFISIENAVYNVGTADEMKCGIHQSRSVVFPDHDVGCVCAETPKSFSKRIRRSTPHTTHRVFSQKQDKSKKQKQDPRQRAGATLSVGIESYYSIRCERGRQPHCRLSHLPQKGSFSFDELSTRKDVCVWAVQSMVKKDVA